MTRPHGSIVVLSGGVGGAKLVDGLAQVLPAEALTVILNTGDDFVHWGLRISPDVDTVMYTLAGLVHPQQGWGLAGDTFRAQAAVERYGGAAWFRLGDQDLATHLERTAALAHGETLTQVTGRLCRALGVRSRLLPMSDDWRRTRLDTREHGLLDFQEYFVRHHAQPTVRGVLLEEGASPTSQVLEALEGADCIVLGPSNPYVSIDPIITLPGVRERLRHKPVVAVSPIVRGEAIKGPLAGMITSLNAGVPGPGVIARHYQDFLKALVFEAGDALEAPGLARLETQTVMGTREDRRRLAQQILDFIARGGWAA